MGANLLETADEHTGPVESRNSTLHVDDDVVDAGGDQLGDLVPQLGRGVDVDLAADRNDGLPIDVARQSVRSTRSLPRMPAVTGLDGRFSRAPDIQQEYETTRARQPHMEVPTLLTGTARCRCHLRQFERECRPRSQPPLRGGAGGPTRRRPRSRGAVDPPRSWSRRARRRPPRGPPGPLPTWWPRTPRVGSASPGGTRRSR